VVSAEANLDVRAKAAQNKTSEIDTPRSDFGTILIHWIVVVAALVSLVTGIRIAADAPGAVIADFLEPIAPNGEVWSFHIFAGLTFAFCIAAYAIYIYRAALARRNALKRVRALTMPAPRKARWGAVNILLHWLAYGMITALTATGVLLYLGWGGWIVDVHRILAWVMLAYIVIHTLTHFMYGGWGQILRLFRAAPLARSELTRAFPLGVAVVAGAAVAGAVAATDVATRPDLVARATASPPQLDGRLDDPVWQDADTAAVWTHQGEDLGGAGRTRVEMWAAYDAENVYLAFRWSDPSYSLMRLPIRKEADGWHVMGTQAGTADVTDYYEDKLAILFTAKPAFGGGGTTYMGEKPLADKPPAANRRGLHYTADGTIHDLWQWKAARGGMMGYVDDMYIGPPIEPNPAQAAGKERYSGGYLPDPGKAVYEYTFKPRRPMHYEGPVDVKWLPADLQAVQRAMKSVPAPDASVEDGSVWWFTRETVVPYSEERDAAIPVGTVLPGVVNIHDYQGDRADIRGGARWQDGYWTLETVRRRSTGSKYDTAFQPGAPLYVYLAVFDHNQTRHTRHERPVVLELE